MIVVFCYVIFFPKTNFMCVLKLDKELLWRHSLIY